MEHLLKFGGFFFKNKGNLTGEKNCENCVAFFLEVIEENKSSHSLIIGTLFYHCVLVFRSSRQYNSRSIPAKKLFIIACQKCDKPRECQLICKLD